MIEIGINENDPLRIGANKTHEKSQLKEQSWSLSGYCSKLIHISQIDFNYNFTQLSYSLFSPSKLYQHSKTYKGIILHILESQNYQIKEDPFFLIIILIFLFVSAMSYSIFFGRYNLKLY